MSITAACFDFETSNLYGDFGILLCCVFRTSQGEELVFRGDTYDTWENERSNDSQIVMDVASELSKYDILAAHFGTGFDLKFLRTRLLKWKLPPFPKVKILDPWKITKNNLSMSSYSLKRLCDLCGFNEKTEVTGEHWMKAALDGDQEAMDYIVEHCLADVEMLEKLVDLVKPYSSSFNAWGSGF